MDNRPIGVFDSGVGGLTVVKQLQRVLPGEEIIYFGDTARVPYGSKSKETVTRFSKQDIRFLLSKEVKAVVIACNTASSNSLEALKEEFTIPLFDVVGPGAESAVTATKNKRIGIIGTSATIKSGAYQNLIRQYDREIQVFAQACSLFVPLAEEGWTENDIALLTAKSYLTGLTDKGIDTLVMGCTHYPLLRRCIETVCGDKVTLVDPACRTAEKVKAYLQIHRQLSGLDSTDAHSFYVSDITEKFPLICGKALQKTYFPEKIAIEKY